MSIACVYKIVNINNGHEYVGSALKGFDWRKRKHLRELKQKKHHNRHLQNAYNIYGENSFSFQILEIVENISILTQKEQEWVNRLNPVYNVMRDIKSHIGVKRSPETCLKISQALIGSHHSKETKEKLRQLGLGKKQSPETIKKRMVNQYKPILQLDKDFNIIREWNSATEASLLNGFNRKCIYRCLWGLRPTYKGFRWQKKII
jgi:group I intron endonuclease